MQTKYSIDQLIGEISPLPEAVVEVLDIIDKPKTDMTMLQQAINKDTVLAARILSVANSPFYGFPGLVKTVKDACILLGVHNIRHVVTAAGVISTFSSTTNASPRHTELWGHSVDVAVASKVVADYCNYNREVAFTAGLLHDIGKLALSSSRPELMREISEFASKKSCSLCAAEESILGFNHCSIGGGIALRWRLPEEFILGIRFHHQPDLCSGSNIADVIYIADKLVHLIASDMGQNEYASYLEGSETKIFNCFENNIDEIVGAVKELSSQAGAFH